MKKAHLIISHLQSTPYLKDLQKTKCYKKLLALLPESLQKGVFFLYNKNDTLFFVLKHPVFKAEFYHKSSMIKNLLDTLISLDPECSCIQAKNIKFFITNKKSEKLHVSSATLPIYKERSKGNFANQLSDEKIHKLFEDIRKCIKNSNNQ